MHKLVSIDKIWTYEQTVYEKGSKSVKVSLEFTLEGFTFWWWDWRQNLSLVQLKERKICLHCLENEVERR